ncbi:MAG: YciI family protein [Sulfuricaulis sp.]
MKFMILMIPAVYQGAKKPDPGFVPDPKKVERMTQFNREMGIALKVLDLNGLHPQVTGARVAFAKGKTNVTDGPFIEAKEVLGGYWLVDADSKEEVVKWAKKCPADDGDVIEIRQIFGPDDFDIAK